MKNIICLSSVIFVLLFSALTVFASPDDNGAAELATANHSRETVNELRLFWDEKDLYVESATRNEKPISQVAENMSVVTSKEIEDMGVHTVAEVLERVTVFTRDIRNPQA